MNNEVWTEGNEMKHEQYEINNVTRSKKDHKIFLIYYLVRKISKSKLKIQITLNQIQITSNQIVIKSPLSLHISKREIFLHWFI